ncbi:MAG: hypothetical protein IPM39_17785 [Chloroflexi bacterium]|nr:hypothetical protein [Chloroflexota bacterium]
MDIGELLLRAGRITWRHKTLWWLGLLPGLTHVVTALLRLWFTGYARREWWPLLAGLDPARLPALEQWLFSPALSGALFNAQFMVTAVLWLFLAGIGYWLVFTLAEASVIAVTLGIVNGRPISVGRSLAIGRRFLGRFIAIDAVVFLPWFVLALAAMLVGLVTVAATAVFALQETAVQSLIATMGLGLSCAALLACLLLPVSFLSVRFRALAFRDTAAVGGPVRQSIRHTWQTIRQNLAEVLILVAMLWGLQYIFNLLMSLVSLPLGLAAAVPTLLSFSQTTGGATTAAANLLSLAAAVLLAAPQALLFVYVSVAWTLAYMQWAGSEQRTQSEI